MSEKSKDAEQNIHQLLDEYNNQAETEKQKALYKKELKDVIRNTGQTDNKIIDDESKRVQASLSIGEHECRDRQYTIMLENAVTRYIKSQKENGIFKQVFFWVVIGAFVLTLVGGIVVILFANVAANGIILSSQWDALESSIIPILPSLSAMLGSIATIITAITILPKIIAQYLFNVKEQQDLVSLINAMQHNDEELRKVVTLKKEEN